MKREKRLELEKRIDMLIENKRLPQSILIIGRKQWSPLNKGFYIASKILGNDDLKDGFHPDFLMIDVEENKKNITIEQIRKVKEFSFITPQLSNNKVILINNAELMSVEASNSILKILEEPIHNRYILLICSNKNRLLPTIISRCIVFNIKPFEEADFNLINSEKLFEIREIFENILNKDYSTFHLIDQFYRTYEQIGREFFYIIVAINNYFYDKEEGSISRANILQTLLNIERLTELNINVKYLITLIALYLSEKKFEKGVISFE